MAKFLDVFVDATKFGTKIPTEEYLEIGRYPIIDQGQKHISGFRDDDNGLFTDTPALIFGDHTRVIKYIDEPFFLGADGVKLLRAKINNVDYKYLYYALCNAKIPDTGYNRHFKWMKETEIPIPALQKQRKVAATLDKVTHLIDLCKQQLETLDLLVKSRFIEMFGDPVINPYKWIVKSVIEECECMVPGRDKPKSFTGDIPWITIDDLTINGITLCSKCGLGLTMEEIQQVNRKTIPTGSVIMSCVGNLGICSIAGKEMVINQQLHSFQCGKKINNVYLMYNLTYRKDYMNKWASSTTVLYMNKSICNSIPIMIPPLAFQQQFAAFVESTDKSKLAVQKQLETLETLKKSLMQEYFS